MVEKYLIKNAQIWTADEKALWADSIVICGDTIEFVGSENEAVKVCDSDAKVIDCQGKMVIPAFIDSHVHVISIAKTLWCLLLEQREYDSIEEILEIVKAYAEEHPKEEVPYIYAYSCPTHLMDVKHADCKLMDKYISDRPVMLCDANYHRCLVNSTMLELMEVDETVPYNHDISHNYERFEGSNIPNGIISEHAYEFYHDIDKMYDKIGWRPPVESDPEVIRPILDIMTGLGICGVHDGFTESENTLIGLKALEEKGGLNHYFHAMPLMNEISELENTINTAKEWAAKYNDDHITVDSIKIFLDGTNELGTGAVIEPFINEPDNYGIMNYSEDDLTHIFERINQEGLSIQIHLVGDRSFRTSLNAMERAQKSERAAGREYTSRISLLHCELTHPDDRKRPAQLGAYINFTPVWAGGLFGDASKQYIGEERYNSMYAFNEMIESGAVVNFSCDMVDEEGIPYMGPLLGIQIGHTRLDEELVGVVREPVSEKMSREALMLGYTINNAKGMGIADKTGSLEKGKKANLCIIGENIFDVPENRIKDIEVKTVMFEGRVVKGEL